MKKLAILLLISVVPACATIESKAYLSQPVGRTLQTGIGGVIVRIDRKRNLENAFGKADLYGRKTYEGFSELRFMGVQDGQVAVRRVDVFVQSDETTMSRSGVYIPGNSTSTTTGMIGSAPFMATTTRQGPGVYIPPRPSRTSVSEPSIVDFLVPIGHPIPFEGSIVTIASADSVSVSYALQKTGD